MGRAQSYTVTDLGYVPNSGFTPLHKRVQCSQYSTSVEGWSRMSRRACSTLSCPKLPRIHPLRACKKRRDAYVVGLLFAGLQEAAKVEDPQPGEQPAAPAIPRVLPHDPAPSGRDGVPRPQRQRVVRRHRAGKGGRET
eukprot:9459028-Pyramimonas_sp.AAC.1